MAPRLTNTESSSGRGWILAGSLALRDLWHDRRTTLALVFTVREESGVRGGRALRPDVHGFMAT